jgi:hypothetical protein
LIVTFGLRPAFASAERSLQPQPPQKPVASDEVDGFLAIDRQGNVAVFSGKVDLGTGVRTAITQIVAEELDVSMARINVIQGDTSLTPDQGPTFGSLSIEIGGMWATSTDGQPHAPGTDTLRPLACNQRRLEHIPDSDISGCAGH